MWNANPLQAERLSFIHCGSSTQRGQFTFFLTPNPCCGDVECQPLQAERLSFIHYGSSTQRGQFTFLALCLTPAAVMWNAYPSAGREIIVNTLWLKYTSGQVTVILTPNPRCGDVECQPPAGRDIVFYTFWLEYTKGAVHISPNA